MQLDIERYRHRLDRYDISDEAKVHLIEQMWRIAMSCVDRAWGDAPEQISLGINGTKCPARLHDRLDSMAQLTPTFNDAADEDAARKTNS